MVYRSSFSQHILYERCPRLWYYQYVRKIPVISDMSYADAGDVIHKTLQYWYNDKSVTQEYLKEHFNKLWDSKKLNESKLSLQRDNYWLMVLQGMKLNLNLTTTELKIFYPEAVAYIDGVDSQEDILIDWKSSTRSEENEQEYTRQGHFYAYMYYRKFGRVPKKIIFYYLKYNGNKGEFWFVPTLADILETDTWYNRILTEMEKWIREKNPPEKCETCFIFCPFKNLCSGDINCLKYTLVLMNNYIYLDGLITPILNKQLLRKFSYELKNSYFIKKHNPMARTTIEFWYPHKKVLPIGFKDGLLKTLKDYGDYLRIKEGKNVVVDIRDDRVFNDEKIDMPEKFLNGIVLRDYQNESADVMLRSKIGILQLATGAGKTEVAIEIVRRLGYKTLFVVEKRELLIQTKIRMEKALGIEVGVIGYGEFNPKHITIATIQTLVKHLKEHKDYLKSIRVAMFDECHHVSSKSFWKLAHYLPNTEYRIGFSGTATRDDGEEMKIFASTGNIIYDIDSQKLIQMGYLIQPQIIFIKDFLDDYNIGQLELDSQTGLINETDNYRLYYENFISNSDIRNRIISELCSKHKDKKILILTKLIEHGEILKNSIPGSEHLWGETKKDIRKDILERFIKGDLNILISTISIFSEGIDIPSLNIVINASCNAGNVKTIQVLGRVLRQLEGKKDAIYYDFIDESKFFKKASLKRRRALLNQGHEVETITYKS